MRKYMLANPKKRGNIDLRDYEDVIIAAVKEFSPQNSVVVTKDYYTVQTPLSQSQAVRIGRRICESELSKHCIQLSKLFTSTVVKEKSNGNNDKSKQNGGHH